MRGYTPSSELVRLERRIRRLRTADRWLARVMWSSLLLGVLCLLLAAAGKARAQEVIYEGAVSDGSETVVSGPQSQPYIQAWAIRGQALSQEEADEVLSTATRGYWGGEVIGRVPFGPSWAILARAGVEGASGKFVMQDLRTWTRGVLEGGLAWHFVAGDRYSCAVVAGGGATMLLSGGDPVAGIPAKAGGGVHCRDERLRMWGQARVIYDPALGGGAHLEAIVHAPLWGERTALGVAVATGAAPRIDLQMKARVWQR